MSYSTLTNTVYCQTANGGTINQIAKINNTTYSVSYTTLGGGTNSEGDVFVNPTNNYLYVVESTDNQVRVFDLANSLNPITTVSVGSSPLGIAFKQSNNTIFVTNRSSNTISVINCTTNTVTTTYSSASFNAPWTITYNSINDNIYVGNNATVSGNYLQVILNSSTGSFVKINNTVARAWWSAHNTNNNRLYVPQNGGSGTMVICCSNPPTPTPTVGVYVYLGRTVPDRPSSSTACNDYSAVRGYSIQRSTITSIIPGDIVYDTYPSTPTNGGFNWLAIKLNGTGPAYAIQISNTGVIISVVPC